MSEPVKKTVPQRTNNAAEKLAEKLSPVILDAITSGEVAFVGLTVVVDNKKSITFPFSTPITDPENEELTASQNEDRVKGTLLAAIEYARTAGVLKARSIQELETFFEQ